MNSDKNDELLSRIASIYAQYEGEQLLREASELEASGAAYVSPRMDMKVRAAVNAGRRTRFFRAGALAAACLALFLLAPQILRQTTGGQSSAAPQAAAQEEMAVTDEAIIEETEAQQPEPETERDSGVLGSGAEVIPLAFELPEGFAVAGVELDNAQSVYRIENAMLDDVVMTLEYTPEPPEFEGLAEIDLGGRSAWGRSGGGYSLLSIEKDSVLYVLTCKHDINTLAALGRAIAA